MPASAQKSFPPGGVSPVFNEITAMLTMSPARPDPSIPFDQLTGPKDRILKKNVIDESGIVLPTIFVRSETFKDPNTQMTSQVLSLAACSAIGTSRLSGGEGCRACEECKRSSRHGPNASTRCPACLGHAADWGACRHPRNRLRWEKFKRCHRTATFLRE
jgi:hypothetical protein